MVEVAQWVEQLYGSTTCQWFNSAPNHQNKGLDFFSIPFFYGIKVFIGKYKCQLQDLSHIIQVQ